MKWALILLLTGALHSEPLPSWKPPIREQILSFVEEVVKCVPIQDRIAVFDNDGTLWSEKPAYFQLLFALDRAGQPLTPLSEHEVAELVAKTHANQTTEEFANAVQNWLQTARHPRFNRPYTELTFKPMQELIDFLKSKQFRVYIVSGGGVEFIRVFSEQVYGIPPEQVIGSSIETKYQNGQLVRLPSLFFLNDGPGKPVGIYRHIGKRPILAVGNSDGDFEMLEWVTSHRPSLGLLLHHDDSVREWAYDKDSPVGKLDRGLAEAKSRGWLVISMKNDWSTVYD